MLACLKGMGQRWGMELRHLRYFAAIAEAGSFTRAAARLRVTQPTLSRQMRDLEDAVGAALFTRRGGPVELTVAGRHLLEGARRALEGMDGLIAETRALGARKGCLRVGYFGPFSSDLMAGPLRRFKRAEPGVEVELIDAAPGLLADRLDEGGIDLALLGHATEEQLRRFAVRPMARVPMLLALPAGHAEAKRRVIELGTLREEAFIGYTEREFPERTGLLREACRARGFEPRLARRVDSLSSMLLAVGAGEGIGFAATYARSLPHAGVVFSTLKPPGLAFTFHAAWRRGAVDPTLRSLIDLLPEV